MALAFPVAACAHEMGPGGISVTGVGEVMTVPDVAMITISVTARDRDATAAQAEVDRVTAAALEVVDELGVGERDVTAAVMRLNPIYRRPRAPDDLQTIEAFQASRKITVRVRDLGRLGDVVNGALQRGINGIDRIELDSSERDDLEQEALDRAIDAAKREAEQVAKRFGVPLGELTQAAVGQAQVPRFGQVTMAMAREEIPFRPGEFAIMRQVNATFAIGK
jgi:uncharacterized protein YggE